MSETLKVSTPRRLKEMVPADIAACIALDARLIVPVGTCEQHGPHLPPGCDTIIVEHLADDLSAEFGVLRAPSLEYGVNAQTDGLRPGNASLRRKTLHRTLNDLLDSWETSGIREFILLTANGFEAHAEALATVVTKVARVRVVDVFAIPHADLLVGGTEPRHGDETDTSLMLHVAPHLVRMELAQDYTVGPGRRRRYTRASLRIPTDSSGSIGRPELATPETGAKVYERILSRIRERIFVAPPAES